MKSALYLERLAASLPEWTMNSKCNCLTCQQLKEHAESQPDWKKRE